jgi:hypothetical protein
MQKKAGEWLVVWLLRGWMIWWGMGILWRVSPSSAFVQYLMDVDPEQPPNQKERDDGQ